MAVVTAEGDCLCKGDFPESSGLQVQCTSDSGFVSFNPYRGEGS